MARSPSLFVAVFLILPARLLAQVPDRLPTVSFSGGPLGRQVRVASHIVALAVDRVDLKEGVIVYQKVADLKGQLKELEVRHPIPEGSDLFDWARPGRQAVAFYQADCVATCVGNRWYGTPGKDAESGSFVHLPPLTTTYIGSVEKLRQHVKEILAGREVVITTESWASAHPSPWAPLSLDRDWEHGEKGRVCRIRASLRIDNETAVKLGEGNNFVGWGVGDANTVPGLIASLRGRDASARAEAAVDLGGLGQAASAAVPVLRERIRDDDAHVRLHAAVALAHIEAESKLPVSSLLAMLKDQKEPLQLRAARALADLGGRAAVAVPVLLKLLQNSPHESTRDVAAFALGEIGSDLPTYSEQTKVVKALARACRDKRCNQVVHALGRFRQPLREAVPELLPIFRDSERNDASDIVWTLSELGPGMLPEWIGILKDANCVGVHRSVRDVLVELGSRARAAAPAIEEGLTHELEWFQLDSARALIAVDPERAARVAVPVLSKLAQHEDREVRREAFCHLRSLGARSAAALPVLMEALNDDHPWERTRATQTLGAIGPRARRAWGSLWQALHSRSPNIQAAAAVALWQIDPENRSSVAALVELLQTPDGSQWATDALVVLGADARPALPVLRRLLRDPRSPDRVTLAHALWRIDRPEHVAGQVHDGRQEALEVLLQVLRSGLAPERSWAVRVLGEIGPEAHRAVAALKSLLEDDDLHLRRCAAVALCCIETRSSASMGVLIRLLESGSDQSVIHDLRELGPKAKEAVPALLRCLRRQPEEFWRLVQAIRQIDPEAATKHGLP